MRNEKPSRYAARLNSFRVGAEDYWPTRNRITTADLLQRAATVARYARAALYPRLALNERGHRILSEVSSLPAFSPLPPGEGLSPSPA